MLKKKLPVIIVLSITLLITFVYFVTINYTTLFVDNNYQVENYLSLNDLALIKLEDGKKAGLFPSSGVYDFYSSYGEKPKYMTTKGIVVGDKFEDFVEQYGDYYCSSIFSSYHDYNDNSSSYSTNSFYDMTIKDFYDNHILNGEIDIKNNELTFSFRATVSGGEVAYGESLRSDLSRKRYSSFWPSGGIFNPRMQTYTLDSSFAMIDDVYLLDYLSFSHYAY